MNRQIVEYPLTEYYSAIERIVDTCKTDKPQNNYAEWMKPDKKGIHIIRVHFHNIPESVN